MNNFKTLLLIAATAFALTACGDKEEDSGGSNACNACNACEAE
jgi:uncharacterized lipoprotein YehR (DUF1307 family)